MNKDRWSVTHSPTPPRDAKQLAVISALLCRLLREEVSEQLALGSEALTALAADWRKLLFQEATDAHSHSQCARTARRA